MASLSVKHRDLWTAVTAPFATKFGRQRSSDIQGYDASASPGYVYRETESSLVQDADLIGLDQYDRLLVGGYSIRPGRTAITFNLATSASQATQRFFVADQPYEIRSIGLQYNTADGATNTGFITKEVAGQAPGAGVSVQTGTFNLNSTANVVQVAVLPSRTVAGIFGPQEPVISLNTGEMLSFKMASAVTSLAGLNVTIDLLPGNSFPPAVFVANANAAVVTGFFYLANRPVTVTGISMVWGTAATDAGAVTLTVTKDTGTTAAGAGTALLAAVQSVKGAINTPVNPALTATASALTLAAGDRLAIKTAGTLTALAGVVVVVSFANAAPMAYILGGSVAGMTTAIFNQAPQVAAGTAAGFFIAARDYRIDDVSAIWGTAGTSGDITVTIDGSTVADGAGTSVLTDNTNAGLSYAGTHNTTNVGTLSVSSRNRLLPAGSRLSAAYTTTTLGSLANVVIAVSLIPW
jgi:hypothetical protein